MLCRVDLDFTMTTKVVRTVTMRASAAVASTRFFLRIVRGTVCLQNGSLAYARGRSVRQRSRSSASSDARRYRSSGWAARQRWRIARRAGEIGLAPRLRGLDDL